MKKFVLVVALALLIVMAALPVMAAGNRTASFIKANAEVAFANLRIEVLVFLAQNDGNPNTDLVALVDKTNAIAADVIDSLNADGIEAACEVTPYVIDGKTVYIDPIIIINVPGGH